MLMGSGIRDLRIMNMKNRFNHEEESSVLNALNLGSPLEKQLQPTISPQTDFPYLPSVSHLQNPTDSISNLNSSSTITDGFSQDQLFFEQNASSSTMENGFDHDGLFFEQSPGDGSQLEGQQPILDLNNLIEFPVSTGISFSQSTIPSLIPAPSSSPSSDTNSSEDSEDMLLKYISNMLMEENIDLKFDVYPDDPALLAAGKPFYEILGVESPDNSTSNNHSDSSNRSNSVMGNAWPYDPLEFLQLQTNPADSIGFSSQSLFSSTSSFRKVTDGFDASALNSFSVNDLFAQSQPAFQFQRGLEEARKFLPSDVKLVIDLEATGFHVSQDQKDGMLLAQVKAETEEEPSVHGPRGRKNPHDDDLDVHEGRSVKLSAHAIEETLQLRNEFDKVLLSSGDQCASEDICKLQSELLIEVSKQSSSNNSKGAGKGRGKKQPKKEVVDLRTLLIHCAQAVATDDRRSAHEFLKQIRKHSTLNGDANQRLAYYFADGLEARLAGSGSQIYKSLVLKQIPITNILKAYKLYMAALPFKKISYSFSNQTYLKVSEKSTKVHIIDFGIAYGFQWPCFMQHLAKRAGGPPRLRITGIDRPQRGFRPTELIDETGKRLTDYAKSFSIPFHYEAIATANWETIKIEDLNIEKDEVLIVNSLYQFRKLVDETVVVDGPRDMVLNNIRKLKPDLFILGILNGSYSAPFFVTRFREALFHFSACFDMVDATIPRENEERQLIESIMFAREAMNIISCEGAERLERPETYKQWQGRNLRAGFRQLPLDHTILKKTREKLKSYNKNFIMDEDNQWLLQGWKGRIMYGLSLWKPCDFF